MSSPSSIASSSGGRLDAKNSPSKAMNTPGARRHSASPRRARYERARRPSDPERPRDRAYTPPRPQHQPRHGNEPREEQRLQGNFPRSGDDYQREYRPATRQFDLRVDTRMENRTRDGPASNTPYSGDGDHRRGLEPPHSAGGATRRQNHAQRRTAKWKSGGAAAKKGYNYNNQHRQHQYQNRKPWNRNQKPIEDTPTSPEIQRYPSPTQNHPSTDQDTTLSPAELDHAKDLVLDLLGWGVPPQDLLDHGVSHSLVHRIFTDLNLQLPQNFAYPPAPVAS